MNYKVKSSKLFLIRWNKSFHFLSFRFLSNINFLKK